MKPPSRQLLMVASSITLAMTLLMALCLSLAQGAGSLTRVTVGSESDRWSRFPSLSADGTKIAFVSDSDFFGQGIQFDQWEIWLYDTTTMTLTRVTTASDSNRFSFGPSLSADGTKVAFHSDSDFLNQGIPAYQFEVWLYDTVMMTYTRITTASDSNRDSLFPSLNANGEKVAFRSDSDFLNQGIPADQREVWLYDTTTMTYTRITTASDSNRDSGESDSFKGVSLSTDGTRIAFASDSDLLNQGIPDEQYEVWLYDTTTMTYTRITTASDSSERIGTLSISADGTKVAFASNSDYLGQGIPVGQLEVWLYDTTTGALTRVTTASESNRWSFHSSLNANGTKIAFMSDADLLGQGDVLRGQAEIWLYDTMTRTLTRVTTASGSGIRASEAPSLNADGTKIAFMSDADFLGQGIPETQKEIWLYEVPEMPANSIYLPIILKDSSYFFLSQRTKKPVFLKKTGFYAASAYQLPHVTNLLF